MPRLDSQLAATLLSLALAFGTGCGDSKTVTPPPPPPPPPAAYPAITSFSASAGAITLGASTELTAVFANGTGTLSPGGQVVSGTPVSVSPATTTVYTLAVTNADGQVVTALVEVTVVAAPAIQGFTAAQSPVVAGQTTVLTPIFSGGEGSIDNGVGPVTSGNRIGVGPAATTTYTLTVTNSLGSTATRPLTLETAAAVPAQVSGGSLFAQDRVHPGDDLNLASVASAAAPAPAVTWAVTSGAVNGSASGPLLGYTAPSTPGLFSVSALVQDAGGNATTLTQPVEAVTDASVVDPRGTRQRAAAATVLADGRVLVTGTLDVLTLDYGFVDNQATPPVHAAWSGATAGGDLFDPLSGTWKPAGSMATPRLAHTMTLLPDGRVLVAGGVGIAATNGQLASCELYDPATRTFGAAAPMSAHRANHAATLLPSGQVLVTGGVSLAGAKTLAAELYDPATNTWAGAGTTTAHDAGTATLLPSGLVLAAGGAGSTGAELYDPATNAWTVAAKPLVVGQAGGAAVLLPSGQVLVSDGGTTSTTELYDPATNTWSAAAARSVSGTGAVRTTLLSGGLVLAVGSTATAIPELYDPAANTWRPAARPRAARGALAGLVTLPGGRVMAVGGGQDAAAPEIYDPQADAWSLGGASALPRSLHTTTLLKDGRVLVAGGQPLQAEVYDPATGWGPAGTMLQPRTLHAAVLLDDGRVLVAGPGASAELYDPATNGWSAAASMAYARSGLTLTMLPGGKVLATGGGNATYGNLDSAELYDPVADGWSTVASMTGGRRNHSATLLASGKVLVAGGVSRTGAIATAQLYDPAHDAWAPVADLGSVRQLHTATLLPGGQVLLAGGADDANSLLNSELFDPATSGWTAIPMAGATRRHSATLLPGGRVLVLGGLDVDPGGAFLLPNNAARATAQLFDPATGRWSAAGGLAFPRADHGAALLGNGKVLVTGGSFNQLRYVQVNASMYQVYTDNHLISASELWK